MSTNLSSAFNEDLSQLIHEYEERGLSPDEILDALKLYSEYVSVESLP